MYMGISLLPKRMALNLDRLNVQFRPKMASQFSKNTGSTARKVGEAIKAQIKSGAYASGARLPSTRALAEEWGISRTTVTAAYEQLAAEGYLETKQGARATVARELSKESASLKSRAPALQPRLSAYGRRVTTLPSPTPPDAGRMLADFRYGDLAASDFPALAWKRAVGASILRRPTRLRYGDPAGAPELRTALQTYLWRARGLRCSTDQIVAVNGSQQGLDLCARLLVDSGERVILENPCYAIARQAFQAAGAELVPRAVDTQGMRTDGLPAARLAYVTPSHQFPLGSVMSVGRRRELLAWARRNRAYILEDDYDSEYRFDIRPIPPLQTLDEAERVIYLGTVSKILSPTLRLGYLVVPEALVATFRNAKRLIDRHTATLEQEALASFFEDGSYERHVRRIRRKNGARRTALLNALSETLGDRVTIAGADAGLHVVIWLNHIPRKREGELLARANVAGIGLYAISPLYDARFGQPNRVGLVMGYAALDERSIAHGVRRMAEIIRGLESRGPRKRGPLNPAT
ncbi:MAG: MocR-like pyridoxine biosynthesis transcription factor PdxR [Alphaproteobacteria bacterium]